MRHLRKVTLTWEEKPPERFSVSYITKNGVEHSKSFSRFEAESIDQYLQRIGRACVGAAKGDLT